MNVLAEYTDEKGRPFKLLGDTDELKRWMNVWLAVPDSGSDAYDDDDHSLERCVMPHTNEKSPTAAERQADKDSLQKFFFYTAADWKKILEELPRKKNGTLAKGRVHLVATLPSFSHYWEDSYCWNMPGVKIRTISDDTAEMEIGDYNEKY